jgi:hypothetical protein
MLVGDFEGQVLRLDVFSHEIDHEHEHRWEFETIFLLVVKTNCWSLVSGSPKRTTTSTATEKGNVM